MRLPQGDPKDWLLGFWLQPEYDQHGRMRLEVPQAALPTFRPDLRVKGWSWKGENEVRPMFASGPYLTYVMMMSGVNLKRIIPPAVCVGMADMMARFLQTGPPGQMKMEELEDLVRMFRAFGERDWSLFPGWDNEAVRD